MKSAVSRALETSWADATPLAKFVEERALGLVPQPTFFQEAPPLGKARPVMEQLAISLHIQTHMPASQKAAKDETINDLVARRLVGLGRAPRSRNIQSIDPSFWIDAEIDWEQDAAVRGRKKMVAIRLVLPDAIKEMQPTSEARSGPPSERDLILAAIEQYAKKKNDPALRRPPGERYAAYRAFITEKGRNPRSERGFSVSAFEKFELEYRQRIK